MTACSTLARKYNVTLSLGDGLRPGAGCDAGDAAQWEEVMTLGALAKRGLEYGVQCMIEGPGHVPMNEVEAQIIEHQKDHPRRAALRARPPDHRLPRRGMTTSPEPSAEPWPYAWASTSCAT